ncbi:MAG: PD-(D/E)XK nuclease family transposase [Sphingobacterium sp.]
MNLLSISLPLFNKQPEELKTVMDQWLYLLKHLSTMDRLPSFLDKRTFGLIFEIGEIGKLTEEELMSYEASLKHKRDAESVFNSALKSGEALGHAKGNHVSIFRSSLNWLSKLLTIESIMGFVGDNESIVSRISFERFFF